MASYSPQLLWECVKKNSSFIRKSPNMPVMSAEQGNLCGLNSYKFSGLTGAATLGLHSEKKGSKESIVLRKSHSKASRSARPSAMIVETGIPKQGKKAAQALEKSLGAAYYRRDLLALAKTKCDKLRTSFKKKPLTIKSRRNKK
eukprot:TRINITY_DN1358_c0_g1_i1.p2 TRINITY_DN1358_c0_g1~~TRINITY_DN1358_c0_g1_i1.p2  ORF type:complete len:144 (+),score=45.53 TRINITY_DN1358_c0_g1_i1:160-591(+)